MTRSPRITSKTGSPIEIWKLPTVEIIAWLSVSKPSYSKGVETIPINRTCKKFQSHGLTVIDLISWSWSYFHELVETNFVKWNSVSWSRNQIREVELTFVESKSISWSWNQFREVELTFVKLKSISRSGTHFREVEINFVKLKSISWSGTHFREVEIHFVKLKSILRSQESLLPKWKLPLLQS